MPQTNNQMLKQLCKDMKSLIKTIRGDPDDHEDMGLIGDVHDNTKFRRTTTRFLWILIVAMTGLWGTVIAQVIIINGGN